MHEFDRKLIWLMAIRVLVVLSILLPYLISPSGDSAETGIFQIIGSFQELLYETLDEDQEGPPRRDSHPEGRILQMLIAVVSIQTLLYITLLRVFRGRYLINAYAQLVGDIVLVTLLIYKFGTITANLSILYFVIVAVGSFLLRSRRAGLTVATLAALFYGSVVIAHQSSTFRALWESGGPLAVSVTARDPFDAPRSAWLERTSRWLAPPQRQDVTGIPLAYNLSIHLIGLYSVAFFTTYLARDTVLERKLEERSLDLAYLKVFHRDVLQSISSGLLVTDLEGVTTSVNRAGAEILHATEEQLSGQHVIEIGLFTPEAWARNKTNSPEARARGEIELLRASTPVFLGFTLSQLRDAEEQHRGFILIFQDLTDWRGLQERVRIQDRMAAIGQMAAGLAHEVGNPLAAISGSVQLLSSKIEGDSSAAKLLDITLRESRRLDRTVKDFLQFAKPRDRHEEPFDIADVLRNDVALLRNSAEVTEQQEIVLVLDPPEAIIVSDRDQISQLFWNLTRNALQAMPDGGRLTIEGTLQDASYRLRVSDTGRGMTEEERAQLFQPFKSFFDGGTGLGMAIVYRIIEEHAGNIEVDSTPGRGTVITIDLPLSPTLERPELLSLEETA